MQRGCEGRLGRAGLVAGCCLFLNQLGMLQHKEVQQDQLSRKIKSYGKSKRRSRHERVKIAQKEALNLISWKVKVNASKPGEKTQYFELEISRGCGRYFAAWNQTLQGKTGYFKGCAPSKYPVATQNLTTIQIIRFE